MEFTKEELLKYYETMLKIRKFDCEAKRAREANEILGNVHVYIGEEAIATGVCACLEKKDYIESTHRGHGHTIAKGADVKAMMAELYGKATGLCKGKGGSQHIADFGVGMLGANGIVGGGFALAVGAALASRFKKTDAISVVFFGDGASNRGTFHEAANMAAAYHLPVIFVCENNGIACSTAHDTGGQQAVQDLSKRALGYNMESYVVNGNDFFSVYKGMSKLVYRARNNIGNRCGFLECKTWRPYGHIVGDKQVYRNPELAKARFKADDCIKNFERRCIEAKWLEMEDFRSVQNHVDMLIEEAKKYALESPYPELSELTTDLYD
ncbi:thiamine pyrophosphate-dependent dehydrogenase E1 component subunit alpha [Acidaminococcus sp. DS4831]|uniref:thiamine pyrophosphate-dependent dehydrogenase E1 component subunit alpha n=1 Tax=Acidaminococcus sp. DS4831 TaxID=3141399 RepID=UPI0032E468FA